MSTQGPYEDMTKQLMQLWQKQWASVMSDKQFIHAMLDALTTMQQGAYAKPQSPASHTAPASDDDDRVAELAARLAACEKRLAKLEAATKPKKPASRSSKPRK